MIYFKNIELTLKTDPKTDLGFNITGWDSISSYKASVNLLLCELIIGNNENVAWTYSHQKLLSSDTYW